MPNEDGYKHEVSHCIRGMANDRVRARRDEFVVFQNGYMEREMLPKLAVAPVAYAAHRKSKKSGKYA